MSKLTPMLQQYYSFKEQYPDCLLFFRMGDFFEMFFEDAVMAAPILDITLTSRSKEQNIPMCGVPVHAAEVYINRLISSGVKVAVCDQVEDPRKAKGIVARAVVRVVTPGMVVSSNIDDPKESRYLVAMAGLREGPDEDFFGLASLELSTGEFLITQVNDRASLAEELIRQGPAEVLISREDEHGLEEMVAELDIYTTLFDAGAFKPGRARQVLDAHFGKHAITGFGVEDMKAGLAAAGAALLYAQETQSQKLTHVDRIRGVRSESFMIIDESSKRNLEIFCSMRDRSRQGSLLGLLDLTVTAMGGRNLVEWLKYPLVDRVRVAERHEAIENLILDGIGRFEMRELMKGVQDLERLTGRVVLGRAVPRDLFALKNSLVKLPEIKTVILEHQTGGLVLDLGQNLDDLADVADLIESALTDNPPQNLKEGGVFRQGFNPDLDELIAIMADGKGWIAGLEKEERRRTGISSLKIGYNRVFGYYIEVTKTNLANVPEHYIRKQTLAGAERYITPELKEQEEKVLGAEEKRVALEQELFEKLRQEVTAHTTRLRKAAGTLAELDVLAALAEAAVKYDYVRPVLLSEDIIEIYGGRHPVIEQSMKAAEFVANDIVLDNESQQVMIITGPNMAGKSTILRQTALIVLMVQIGSFVPADKVRTGLVDRIFTRVGASDDLTRGRSTFMVEMNETAQILNLATNKSLVILDEIGRGTSTFDGLSIAWAVAEYLHDFDDQGVRTLFATHYHELVQLARTKPRVKNYNVAVKEYEGQVIFLRKLLEGGTSRSYGLAVARLAGLPEEVLVRAQEVLGHLENGGLNVTGLPRPVKRGRRTGQTQLSLFAPESNGLTAAVRKIDLDAMTPLQALNKLAELKKLVE